MCEHDTVESAWVHNQFAVWNQPRSSCSGNREWRAGVFVPMRNWGWTCNLPNIVAQIRG